MRWCLCAFLLSIVAQQGVALASPEDLFSFGARSSAMGGLGASFVDDYAAVYSNPASLSRAHERSFTFGYQAAMYRLWLASPIGAGAQPVATDIARGTLVGITFPVPLGSVLRDRVVIGLGLYTPTDLIVRVSILRPEQPQFLVLADRAQSVAIQAGIGISLPYGFRVGAGFAALAQSQGAVTVSPDANGMLNAVVNDRLVAAYSPIAGLSWDRGPFRLAAVYRDPVIATFAVSFMAQNLGIPLPTLNIAGIAQYDPRQVAAEAAFVRHGLTVAVGATFKQWGAYPGPLEPTTPNSPVPPSPNFHDTWVVRVGAEYRHSFGASELGARLGYFFEQSPAPPVSVPGPSAYLDNDRHVATAGFLLGCRALGTRLTVEGYGQVHVLVDRESVSGSGTGLVTQSLQYGGTLYLVGLTATVSF